MGHAAQYGKSSSDPSRDDLVPCTSIMTDSMSIVREPELFRDEAFQILKSPII